MTTLRFHPCAPTYRSDIETHDVAPQSTIWPQLRHHVGEFIKAALAAIPFYAALYATAVWAGY